MHWVQPKVFLIAHSFPAKKFEEWLSFIGAGDYERELRKTSLSAAENIITVAARRCYMSFAPNLNPNIKKIRKDGEEYLTNILASGHGSVLEHASFSYAIENVSRVFTGEMNRHRAGVSISEGSMRFIRYNDLPLVETPFFRSERGKFLREKVEELACLIETRYVELSSNVHDRDSFAIKKEMTSLIRRILPMGIATGGIWTLNVRALRHILALRTTEGAEEEIREVMNLIHKETLPFLPNLLGDFTQTTSGNLVPKHAKV